MKRSVGPSALFISSSLSFLHPSTNLCLSPMKYRSGVFHDEGLFNHPDVPFHNFIASISGEWLILYNSEISYDGFFCTKVTKGTVGMMLQSSLHSGE